MDLNSLSMLPTEVVINITNYLSAYDKLCLRITCKRLYLILTDPHAWSSLLWRDCRRRECDFKALRLALGLARSHVQQILISYNSTTQMFPFSKFLPQVYSCKNVCSLTVVGMPITESTLEKLFSELTSLCFFGISTYGQHLTGEKIVLLTSKQQNIKTLSITDGLFNPPYRIIHAWKNTSFLPPNLQLYGFNHKWHETFLEGLSSSDHPAELSMYQICSPVAGNRIGNYPVLRVLLNPSVKVVTCSMKFSSNKPSNSLILLLSQGKLPNTDLVSASLYQPSDCNYPSGNSCTVPLLPPTIQSLSLQNSTHLSSSDLTVLSECCPNLVHLNISSCKSALHSLQGLADISLNCVNMRSLNILDTHSSESRGTLWEILSAMSKLRHLSISAVLCLPDLVAARPQRTRESKRVSHIRPYDEHSLSHIRGYAAKMNLLTFEITSDPHCIYPIDLEVLLPAFKHLQHLRIILTMAAYEVADVTKILPNLHSLTHFSIMICGYSPKISLPTDPECYSTLKQFCIFSTNPSGAFEITDDLIQALVQSPSLTHLWLDIMKLNDCLYKSLGNFHHLCECHIYVTTRFKLHKSPQKLMDTNGICGSVAVRQESKDHFMVNARIHDLQSLFPTNFRHQLSTTGQSYPYS